MLVLDAAAELRDGAEDPFGFMLAALVHDIGKPRTKSTDEDGIDHFYGHAQLGEKMAVDILNGADPAEMAIGYLPAEDCELIINMATAKELGLTIPDTVLNRARKINE